MLRKCLPLCSLALVFLCSPAGADDSGFVFGVDRATTDTIAGEDFAPFFGFHSGNFLVGASFEYDNRELSDGGSSEIETAVVRVFFRQYYDTSSEAVSPFFSVGVGLVTGEADEGAFGVDASRADFDGPIFHVGFGGEYRFNRHFALGAEARLEIVSIEFDAAGSDADFDSRDFTGHLHATFRY